MRKITWGQIGNAPNTLIGLLGAIGGVQQRGGTEGIFEFAGGWLIGLLHRCGWATAITLGDVILYADAVLIPRLHDHEMVHIRQGRYWGPLFLPLYILESLYQWIKTGDGYHQNRFEVEAYRKHK